MSRQPGSAVRMREMPVAELARCVDCGEYLFALNDGNTDYRCRAINPSERACFDKWLGETLVAAKVLKFSDSVCARHGTKQCRETDCLTLNPKKVPR